MHWMPNNKLDEESAFLTNMSIEKLCKYILFLTYKWRFKLCIQIYVLGSLIHTYVRDEVYICSTKAIY